MPELRAGKLAPQRKLAYGICIGLLVAGILVTTLRGSRDCQTAFAQATADAIACRPSRARVLSVSYEGGRLAVTQQPQLLTRQQTETAPDVQLMEWVSPYATLIMSDPDAPDPAAPSAREWLHWLVVNVPAGKDVAEGQTLMEYAPPTPPVGTHRYILSVYRQHQRLEIPAPAERANFSTRGFLDATSYPGGLVYDESPLVDAVFFTVAA